MTYLAGRSQRTVEFVCHLYSKQIEEKKFEFECPQAYTIRWYVSEALLDILGIWRFVLGSMVMMALEFLCFSLFCFGFGCRVRGGGTRRKVTKLLHSPFYSGGV